MICVNFPESCDSNQCIYLLLEDTEPVAHRGLGLKHRGRTGPEQGLCGNSPEPRSVVTKPKNPDASQQPAEKRSRVSVRGTGVRGQGWRHGPRGVRTRRGGSEGETGVRGGEDSTPGRKVCGQWALSGRPGRLPGRRAPPSPQGGGASVMLKLLPLVK